MCDHQQRSMSTSQKVGYLSPIRLQENMHKFVLSKENKEAAEKDKTPEEAEQAITEMRKRYENIYSLYLGNAMVKFQYRDFLIAPYNFGYWQLYLST
jgi:proline dehydrogenase